MRTVSRPAHLISLAIAIMGILTTSSFAATTVSVVLSDAGTGAAMATDMGMGTPGADPSKGSMHVAAVPTSIVAGDVTFRVTNRSSELVHEMLVVKIDDPSKPLPFDTASAKVDEDKAGSLGEVSELDPGKSGTLTLKLAAGTYVLFCNLPGHFMAGMWTVLSVR